MRRLFIQLTSVIYRRWFAAQVDRQIEQHILMRSHVFGGDSEKVHLASTAIVNNALFNVSSGEIWVEDHVSFGHNVCLLTGAHEPAKRGAERQHEWVMSGHDIIIREGVWLASNVTVIGPAEIGAHTVIAAGAVVRGNIPPRVLAGGVPAKVIREI